MCNNTNEAFGCTVAYDTKERVLGASHGGAEEMNANANRKIIELRRRDGRLRSVVRRYVSSIQSRSSLLTLYMPQLRNAPSPKSSPPNASSPPCTPPSPSASTHTAPPPRATAVRASRRSHEPSLGSVSPSSRVRRRRCFRASAVAPAL